MTARLFFSVLVIIVTLHGCGPDGLTGDESSFDYPYELDYHSKNDLPRRSIELWSNYLYFTYEYPAYFTGETYALHRARGNHFSFETTTRSVEGTFRKVTKIESRCRTYKEVQLYHLDLLYGDSGTKETFVGEFRCEP